ncbi:hypothetical protein KSS87_000612 [Heliosperma pusillum]|nr:hypothetical protein KSS87_000612 [Heliosperma pusillum]
MGEVGRRTMEWAARGGHLGGLPRKAIITTIGAFAKAVTAVMNTTSVHNADTLLRLVRSRPVGVPLLTVSNHMSTLDDPLMWGFKGFPITDARLARWVLTAEDICFKNKVLSYCFRIGKCIPITRGGGIYQEHMNEALERLIDGEWVHTFPEGKVSQEDAPIQRLKWGTASLIVRAPVTPIILPIVHHGFHEVMPEDYMFGRRPPFPLSNKHIKIVVGEPIEFDLPRLRETALAESRVDSSPRLGWPNISPYRLDEAAQRCLPIFSFSRPTTLLFGFKDQPGSLRSSVPLVGLVLQPGWSLAEKVYPSPSPLPPPVSVRFLCRLVSSSLESVVLCCRRCSPSWVVLRVHDWLSPSPSPPPRRFGHACLLVSVFICLSGVSQF